MDYQNLSKEELISEVVKLQSKVNSLENEIALPEDEENFLSEVMQNLHGLTGFDFDKIHRELIVNSIKSLTTPAIVLDLNNNLQACNSPFEILINKKSSEILDKHINDFFSPQILEEINSKRREDEDRGTIINYEIELTDKETKPRFFIISESEYKNLEDIPLGRVIVLEEITEKRRVEQLLRESEHNLREANDVKDKFFSIISHDLKNPFVSLLGFSQLLIDDYDNLSDDERKTFISSIHNTSNYAFKLLNDLQLWSKVTLGKIPVNPEEIYLVELLPDLIDKVKDELKIFSSKILLSLKDPDKIYADRSMAKIIFENIISNAIKFSGKDTEISISAKTSSKFLECEIADNGIGISEEDQAKLFRLEIPTIEIGNKKEKGTGLGLILTKLLIEKNFGSVDVISTEGKGTTVKLVFKTEGDSKN